MLMHSNCMTNDVSDSSKALAVAIPRSGYELFEATSEAITVGGQSIPARFVVSAGKSLDDLTAVRYDNAISSADVDIPDITAELKNGYITFSVYMLYCDETNKIYIYAPKPSRCLSNCESAVKSSQNTVIKLTITIMSVAYEGNETAEVSVALKRRFK